MSKRNFIVTIAMANFLTACSTGKPDADPKMEFEAGWIRFTESKPKPTPVIHPVKPLKPIQPAFSAITTERSSPLPSPTLLATSHAVQSNIPATGVSGVNVSGTNVPLLQAMHKVLPVGWRARLSPDVASGFKETVSWGTGSSWMAVTDKMLAERKLKAVYSDKEKLVTVDYLKQGNNNNSELIASNSKSSSENKNNFPVKPLKIVPVTKVWRVSAGTTLIEGFTKWVEQDKCPSLDGKWKIKRLTDTDYPIDYPLTFNASDLNSAAAQLFELYKHAKTPLYIDGYSAQCIITISESKK